MNDVVTIDLMAIIFSTVIIFFVGFLSGFMYSQWIKKMEINHK